MPLFTWSDFKSNLFTEFCSKDQPQGETCSASASSGQFEVNDDWDAESTVESSPAHMAQLKKKLKARKKMQPWTETPTKGEIEIVISNKKYQGSVQMKPAPQAKEVNSCHLIPRLPFVTVYHFTPAHATGLHTGQWEQTGQFHSGQEHCARWAPHHVSHMMEFFKKFICVVRAQRLSGICA